MFAKWGNFIYRRYWWVLGAGLIFMIISGVYGTTLFSNLKGGGFDYPAAESSQALVTLQEKLGQPDGTLIALFTSKDGLTVESSQYQQAVETTLNQVKGQPGVGTITTFYNSGSKALVALDDHSTYAVIGLNGDQDTQSTVLKDLRPRLTSPNLQVQLGGAPAVNEEVSDQVSKDLETAETLSFPVLAILLIFIFGSLVASALPLTIGGVAILGAFLILRIISNFTDISIFAVNVITMLGLGLAIDYSLFMVNRFREELVHYHGQTDLALRRTMQTAGRTVLFSGMTVVISLLSLLVFPEMFLKSMGMGGAAAVGVAMLSALTVLPAVLAVLGHRVNALKVSRLWSRGPQKVSQPGTGFWYNISTFVMHRPVTVLIVALVPLIWVGLPFLSVKLATPDARSLPTGTPSRVVSEALNNDFPRNETAPIQLVIHTNGAALSGANLNALYDYTQQIAKVNGVRRVDSLVTVDPKMDKAAYQSFYTASNPQASAVAAHFAKDDYTVVNVLYDTDPLADASQDLVRNLRALTPPAGASVQVTGNSAYLVDFLSSLASSIPVALGLIVVVIFVLLFLMLGSLIIPLKAVILNILSLSVSFGALVWIFQEGHLTGLLNFTSVGTIDGTQPVLIFAIAFGLSMDYEVFLLSRVKENYDRTHDNTASVALGVQKTGSIITSAALLLVIVIGSFATGQILFIKQIGIGLGLAVAVDATIVRLLLVPASMRLLGNYNWWAPRPLKALYERVGLSETEPVDEEEAGKPSTEGTPEPALVG